VIVHGGAAPSSGEEWIVQRDAVARAAWAAWETLAANGSALDAVVSAVALLEDDPSLNAGTGSVLTRDGHVEMDAAVMDGRDLAVGAVAGLRRVKNPVRLARSVMGSEHVLLSGAGAEAFAVESGVALCDPASLVVPRERERHARWLEERAAGGRPRAGPADTVGAVAIDRGGNVAAAGSTGGTPGKRSGRIGDCPIPGAGLWADNRAGGAAATGEGEALLRTGASRSAVLALAEAAAQDAAWMTIRALEDRVGGRGGVIVISRDGSIGFAFNTPRMPVAYMDGELARPFVGGGGAGS
jgi:beta-aspartyl-peptidase (threonine type)